MTLVESTSPSALLTASLDAARRHNAIDGARAARETIDLAARRCAAVTRSTASTCSTRRSPRPQRLRLGPAAALGRRPRHRRDRQRDRRHLRERHDIWLELYAENVVVAVFGIGEEVAETGERLLGGAAATRSSARREPRADAPVRPAAALGADRDVPARRLPRAQEIVPFDAAEGRIAAESLAAYPPGVPNVLPGERLSRGDARLHRRLARPRRARSAARATARLKTIRVVIE